MYQQIDITILNSLGQVVSQQQYEGTSQINLELIGSSGLYLININTDTGNNATLKVMKE